MLVASCRLGAKVILEAVSAVEELANIATDVMGEHKSTTWVLINEELNVKHKFVKNDKFAAALYRLLELGLAHSRLRQHEGDLLAQLHPEPNFRGYDEG